MDASRRVLLVARAPACALLLALLLVPLAVGRAQQVPLYPGPQYPAFDAGNAVVVADLDGDGWPDLAVANRTSNDVTVHLGRAAGGFAESGTYDVDVQPTGIAQGDVDEDGIPDLLTCNATTSTVSVLLGDGRGGFAASTGWETGVWPFGMTLADIDGDGHLDAVTANRNGGDVSVLFGMGDGGFRRPENHPVGNFPLAVAAGDLDGDGAPDLVVADSGSLMVSVLINDGRGDMLPATTWFVVQTPADVALGDLDGDGDLDILTANGVLGGQPEKMSVLFGDGAGGFGAASTFDTGAIDGLDAIAVADVDADGRLDAVATDGSFSEGVVMFPGDGAGGFEAAVFLRAGGVTIDVVLADADGDCRIDIVTANSYSDTVSVLSGLGADGFVVPSSVVLPSVPADLALADLDGDGHVDAVTALNTGIHGVAVVHGDGQGGLSAPQTFETPSFPQDVAVGDVDGDGVLDVATVHQPSGEIVVLLGDGFGSLGPPLAEPVGSVPRCLAIADIDGDGDGDALVGTTKAGAGQLVVMISDGTGGFGHVVDHALGGDEPEDLVVVDVNEDGALDVVTVNQATNDVSVLLGDGAGSFGAASTIPVGFVPRAVAFGDVNEDGHVDLTTANNASQDVSVLLGGGLGGFVLGASLPLDHQGSSPRDLVLADVDGDGHADLVVCEGFIALSQIVVMRGDGAGGFGPIERYGTGGSPLALGVADLDEDGRLDVVTAATVDNSVWLSLNQLPSPGEAWLDAGCALAGASGEPRLVGTGDVTPGSRGTIALSDAAPSTLAVLFVSLAPSPAPFKGGVLKAVPSVLELLLATSATGTLDLVYTWPGGVPPGTLILVQDAIQDAGAGQGVALSNSLRAITP